ncbi:hypothetical protein [Shewanella atlantica]|uniref:hypothetical protein n=1 Tax=Shewanella atlantica TaxID=271099 RepID=UPI00163A6627|nr:hypothetical protein [Shewanella atlantica]
MDNIITKDILLISHYGSSAAKGEGVEMHHTSSFHIIEVTCQITSFKYPGDRMQ